MRNSMIIARIDELQQNGGHNADIHCILLNAMQDTGSFIPDETMCTWIAEEESEGEIVQQTIIEFTELARGVMITINSTFQSNTDADGNIIIEEEPDAFMIKLIVNKSNRVNETLELRVYNGFNQLAEVPVITSFLQHLKNNQDPTDFKNTCTLYWTYSDFLEVLFNVEL